MRMQRIASVVLSIVAGWSWAAPVAAEPVVPGTGEAFPKIGDDFEDPQWKFIHNFPKSSSEQDDQIRHPLGRSTNGRWSEGMHRGHPDVVERTTPPEGGIPGSTGALLLQTKHSGIPNRPKGQGGQDDLYMNIRSRIGGHIPVAWSPSVVVRVFVPSLEQWDGRTGASFAFRADVRGRKAGQLEPYWPGLFLMYRRDPRTREEKAYFLLRANERGGDFAGPDITEFGWWTLGMSFSRDGQVHYYARPGVDNLTEADYLGSKYCYGFRAERLDSVFFDVFSRDDGRTWSTPWVIDDPTVYYVPPPTTTVQRNQPAPRSR